MGKGVKTTTDSGRSRKGGVGRLPGAAGFHPLSALVVTDGVPVVFDHPAPESFFVEEAVHLSAALPALARSRFDVVLLSKPMPESRSPAFVYQVQKAAPATAIVVSGTPVKADPTGKSIQIGDQYFYLKDQAAEEFLTVTVAYLQNRTRMLSEISRCKTELAQSKQDLRTTQCQLYQAEKLRDLGQLAAGVAHEVKNPLARILLGVEYLASVDLSTDEHVTEVFEAIMSATHRANDIIIAMVDLSSASEFHPTTADLNKRVQQATLLVQHELIRNNIDLQLELQEDLPPVCCDCAKFEQVLLNLCLNAIHAMEDTPGCQLRISTSLASRKRPDHLPADHFAVLRIDDEGRGLPDDCSRIFEPFFTTKPAGKGTGLGLTICRKIVELHDGTLTVANRPEVGARVTVELPLADSSALDSET